MSPMANELILTAGIIAAWVVVVLYLESIGFWAKRNVTAIGPLLMWKTVRGRELIDRLARRRRFWKVYGDVSIALVAIAMVGITALLVWEAAALVPATPVDRIPPPQTLLGIPGINPVIPVGYGIAGLIVAIVLHEFLHGILARVSKTTIRSLGVLLFVVPIGAFVEPDEEEMKALPRRERARLFSVGPATNLVLAGVFAFLFSGVLMAAVVPVENGVGITGYSMANSPAETAVCTANCAGFAGGLAPRMVVVSVNNTATASTGAFRAAMAEVRPGTPVEIRAWDQGTVRTFSVTPAAGQSGNAILGIFAVDTTTDVYHPLSSADEFGGLAGSMLVYVSLPFTDRAPLQAPVTDFYVVTGPWAALPTWSFWLLANLAYWIFWLNLMVGATNALPAVPLDGGYVFRDAIAWLFANRARTVRAGAGIAAIGLAIVLAGFAFPAGLAPIAFGGLIVLGAGVGILAASRAPAAQPTSDAWVRRLTYAFALLILGLILWQFLGPIALNLAS